MSSSLVSWIVAALLLFWSVGAYNRLVRLRAEANGAFALVAAELSKLADLVRECLPPELVQAAAPPDDELAFWAGLQGAATQFGAALAAARPRPLQPEGIAALSAAYDVLTMAWERAERDDAHDLAGSRLPETLSTRRAHIAQQTQTAAGQFNQAVTVYNDAIAQFPAVLLAWVFGFKPAQGLRA